MKIAVVKDVMSTGRGADRAVAALVNGLAGRGRDVALVTLQGEGTPFSVALDPRVRVVRAALGGVAAAADEADVIVSAGVNELLLLSGARKPVVQQFHIHPSAAFKWRHPLRNRAIRRALEGVAAVQVLLPGHLPALPAALRGRAAVIGNAPTVTPCAGDAELAEERLIVYPAALGRVKNQDVLIRAFAEVVRRHPEWTLELYGTGSEDETKRLHRLVDSLSSRLPSLRGRVRFMGYGDLHAAYARCAFLAFPSRIEGFGLAIAEAAAFGKPAVGFISSPGVNELIVDGRTGLLAKSGPAALADAMARLVADEGLRRRLGGNARERCNALYGAERVLDAWEKLLAALLQAEQ